MIVESNKTADQEKYIFNTLHAQEKNQTLTGPFYKLKAL